MAASATPVPPSAAARGPQRHPAHRSTGSTSAPPAIAAAPEGCVQMASPTNAITAAPKRSSAGSGALAAAVRQRDHERRHGEHAERVGAPPAQPALGERDAERLRRHGAGRQRDQRGGDGGSQHQRAHVVQPAEPEATARDALDQERAQQALGAARDGERHAQLERAAGMRVGGQAAEPGAERQRRPQLPRRHEHHAQVHAAGRPQHGDAHVARERARELGGHEVEGCEGRGRGDEPDLGEADPGNFM